jgi:hypothetical protein
VLNLLTPWSGVLGKVTGSQLVKKFLLDTVYRVVKEALVTRGNLLNIKFSSDFSATL